MSEAAFLVPEPLIPGDSSETPALAETEALGIIWTVPGVRERAATNLATGVLSAAGGKLFSEALKSIGLGDPLPAMLQDITNRLTVIEQSIGELKGKVDQLLQAFQALRNQM